MSRTDRSEWRITSARTYEQGTTYGTNISNGAGGTVSVKHRSSPKGPPYVCLTCLKNACVHITFIRDMEHAATQDQ